MRSTAFWSIVFIVLIGYLGTAMPYPILAPLILGHPVGLTCAWLPPIQMFALLVAIYPAGLLVGSLYCGSLSDRVGRRKVIFFTLLLGSCCNGLAAYAVSRDEFELLLFARLITGFTEGNVSVARAVLADLNLKKDKALAFGYLSSAGYGGYLIGPLLGGYLSVISFGMPFLAAATLCLLAAFLSISFLPETSKEPGSMPQRGSLSFWKEPRIKILLTGYFFVTVTINIYHEFFPVLLVRWWAATAMDISYATVIATSTMILVSIVFMRKILQVWSAQQLYLASMLMLGVSLVLFLSPSQLIYVYPLFVAFGTSLAIFNTSSTTWFSDQYMHLSQGKLMGVTASMFFLSNILVALGGGAVAGWSISILLLVGGATAGIAGISFWSVTRRLSRGFGKSGNDLLS